MPFQTLKSVICWIQFQMEFKENHSIKNVTVIWGLWIYVFSLNDFE